MKIKLGCDPEVFVSKQGVPFSAYGMVPGTKKEPFKVGKGAVQVDGMALEFNTDPASTKKAFVKNVQTVFSKLESMIPPEYKIEVKASVKFDWDHLKAQPKEALELGCEPDFNAYTHDANPRPKADTNLRTASGHVHIGWTKDADIKSRDHFRACCQLAKQLDMFLAIPSLYLDPDTERRILYGKAGCFRPKPYGMEYRTLSNFWLTNPELMEWVWDATTKAVEELTVGNFLFNKLTDPRSSIDDRNGINGYYFKNWLEYAKEYREDALKTIMAPAEGVIKKYGHAK